MTHLPGKKKKKAKTFPNANHKFQKNLMCEEKIQKITLSFKALLAILVKLKYKCIINFFYLPLFDCDSSISKIREIYSVRRERESWRENVLHPSSGHPLYRKERENRVFHVLHQKVSIHQLTCLSSHAKTL